MISASAFIRSQMAPNMRLAGDRIDRITDFTQNSLSDSGSSDRVLSKLTNFQQRAIAYKTVRMLSKQVIWESCYLNFRGLVLGCIETKFCNQSTVGKRLTRSTSSVFFSWPQFSKFRKFSNVFVQNFVEKNVKISWKMVKTLNFSGEKLLSVDYIWTAL